MAQNQAAWITKAFAKPLEVGEAPYPTPGDYDIVIRSAAVAMNPIDWKQQDHSLFLNEFPNIFGCDVAGTVDEVGPKVNGFQKGDRVMGQPSCLVYGKEYGAFQLFVRCAANVACKIPDWMTFEEGSVIPHAINTAAIGLFQKDVVGLPLPSVEPQASGIAVFIYGGSTSVGIAGIQLAKAAGAFVVATCGPSNAELCKHLGADVVVNYRDSNWIAQVVESLKGKQVAGAYDAISSETTIRACAEILAKVGSTGTIAVTGMPIEGVTIQKNILGAATTQDDALATAIWRDFLPQALLHRVMVSKPDAQVVGAGLGDIQHAMDLQKQGVSARKLVVTLP